MKKERKKKGEDDTFSRIKRERKKETYKKKHTKRYMLGKYIWTQPTKKFYTKKI